MSSTRARRPTPPSPEASRSRSSRRATTAATCSTSTRSRRSRRSKSGRRSTSTCLRRAYPWVALGSADVLVSAQAGDFEASLNAEVKASAGASSFASDPSRRRQQPRDGARYGEPHGDGPGGEERGKADRQAPRPFAAQYSSIVKYMPPPGTRGIIPQAMKTEAGRLRTAAMISAADADGHRGREEGDRLRARRACSGAATAQPRAPPTAARGRSLPRRLKSHREASPSPGRPRGFAGARSRTQEAGRAASRPPAPAHELDRLRPPPPICRPRT